MRVADDNTPRTMTNSGGLTECEGSENCAIFRRMLAGDISEANLVHLEAV